MNLKDKKFAIIGAGPSGGILGGHLKTESDVTLVDIWEDHINAIKTKGLIIEGVVKLKVEFEPEKLKTSILELTHNQPDFVFISVKTPFIDRVVKDLVKVISKKAFIISYQNGIATEDYIAQTFGKKRTFRSVINYAGNMHGLGKIDMTFFNPPNYIGPMDKSNDLVAQSLATIITNVGLKTEFQADIRPVSWKKSILNASLSGLCAVTQMNMREAMDFQQTYYIVSNLIKEGINVAKAMGFQFEADYYDKAVAYLSKGGHHKPSMLSDIENRRPTEVAFLNKKIVEYGQKYNIPVPLNEAVTAFIEALDYININTTNYIRKQVLKLEMDQKCLSCAHVKDCIDIYAYCPLSGEAIPSKISKLPTFSNLIFEEIDNIAIIRINNPPSNQLSIQTFVDLKHSMDFIARTSRFQICIITAIGQKFFASGIDLKKVDEDTIDAINTSSRAAIDSIEGLELPTIAAINGYALGGGCEIVLATDIRIASENSHFGLPEVKLGLIPGGGGTQRLTRLLGSSRAAELILTGDIIKSDQALNWGLINHIVPNDQLEQNAILIAKKIIKNAPIAIKKAKKAIRRATTADLDAGLDYENMLFQSVFQTQDRAEGIKAFLEKRPPKFEGK